MLDITFDDVDDSGCCADRSLDIILFTLQFVKERGYGNAMYDIVPSIACIVVL
ncbi:hypothetical protein M405DRAFT_833295, partial [Rhizopogon salebrosus TDB-379]